MAKTYSVVLVGVEPKLIEIETVVGSGFSGLNILGLSSDISRDTRERVRSALEAVGILIPGRRVVVNVSPAESLRLTRTSLTELDFPIAVAVIRALMAAENPSYHVAKTKQIFAGELCLSGHLRPLNSALRFYSYLEDPEFSNIYIPDNNEDTALKKKNFELISHLSVWLETHSSGQSYAPTVKPAQDDVGEERASSDLEKFSLLCSEAEILSKNPKALVAVLVAAAARHHILIAGQPGVGKSFSLTRLVHFLPSPTQREAEQLSLIHGYNHYCEKRPFRSPHHSSTSAALIGGASLKPGEVTLAHSGILFLDELAEFSRGALEALREPLDSEKIHISRSGGFIEYPAAFQLCAATNPCPCGFRFSRSKACRCNVTSLNKYLQKLSGPLLDRFCIQFFLEPDRDKKKNDIFTHHLSEQLQKNSLDAFLQNFLTAQKTLYFAPNKEAYRIPLSAKIIAEEGLSTRGEMKLQRLSHTFATLFPSLEGHPEFIESVLEYRNLEKTLHKGLG